MIRKYIISEIVPRKILKNAENIKLKIIYGIKPKAINSDNIIKRLKKEKNEIHWITTKPYLSKNCFS